MRPCGCRQPSLSGSPQGQDDNMDYEIANTFVLHDEEKRKTRKQIGDAVNPDLDVKLSKHRVPIKRKLLMCNGPRLFPCSGNYEMKSGRSGQMYVEKKKRKKCDWKNIYEREKSQELGVPPTYSFTQLPSHGTMRHPYLYFKAAASSALLEDRDEKMPSDPETRVTATIFDQVDRDFTPSIGFNMYSRNPTMQNGMHKKPQGTLEQKCQHSIQHGEDKNKYPKKEWQEGLKRMFEPIAQIHDQVHCDPSSGMTTRMNGIHENRMQGSHGLQKSYTVAVKYVKCVLPGGEERQEASHQHPMVARGF
ncbi:Trinucleotide Repeat-Containing 18 Protein [Manis pentadactyla]|nr:Trinucleotide Repeat-Containing 18 Protein [Manis pentadactyla]